jgi:hypothetical protein
MNNCRNVSQQKCIQRTCLFLFMNGLISLALLCTAVGPARAETQQDTSPAFTNKDLEPYRPPSTAAETPSRSAVDASVGISKDHTTEKRQKAEKIAGKKEQEYWCKKGRQVNKRLALAKDEVEERTARLHELEAAAAQVIGTRRSTLEKQRNKAGRDLKAATKRLRERQETLAELEHDAYRNNIPAGWLRCQYE